MAARIAHYELLERISDPPRFIFPAAVALEPVGTQWKRWIVFQNHAGV